MGTFMYESPTGLVLEESGLVGFGWLRKNASFFGTQAVLYSPRGRRRLAELAERRPADMQLDGMLAGYASLSLLRVLIAPSALSQQVRALTARTVGSVT